MISELVEELIDNADLHTKELHDLMYRAAETIEILSEKVRADRPQGEWQNYKDEHRCSECGEVVIGDWYDDEWYDYCPNCGAKMK